MNTFMVWVTVVLCVVAEGYIIYLFSLHMMQIYALRAGRKHLHDVDLATAYADHMTNWTAAWWSVGGFVLISYPILRVVVAKVFQIGGEVMIWDVALVAAIIILGSAAILEMAGGGKAIDKIMELQKIAALRSISGQVVGLASSGAALTLRILDKKGDVQRVSFRDSKCPKGVALGETIRVFYEQGERSVDLCSTEGSQELFYTAEHVILNPPSLREGNEKAAMKSAAA